MLNHRHFLLDSYAQAYYIIAHRSVFDGICAHTLCLLHLYRRVTSPPVASRYNTFACKQGHTSVKIKHAHVHVPIPWKCLSKAIGGILDVNMFLFMVKQMK